MQALVLVGGEGTRLRPLTLTRPKPALTLVDRPFIRFMVDWLGRHGVDEVVMACGFRAEDLRSALGDEVPGGARIHYVEEDEPLGTAGPMRLAAERGLLGERFMVLNGDLLSDLDLTALQQTHAARDAVATLALYPVDDPSAYGLVRRGPDDEVLGFVEKPDPDQIDTDEISAGAYVLERSVLDLIPPGRAVSIEREVFPRLVGDGLYGRRLNGYWMDIGTPDRYLQANWDILEGRVRTGLGEDLEAGGLLVEADADCAQAATISPPALVGAGAMVAGGATVGPRAVIGAGCRIGEGASVRSSVLLENCRVGDGAVLDGAILAPEAEVAPGARLSPGSVAGRGERVEGGLPA
jgi:mannose-1-phosphate guanylyltransferase